ncbi:rhodanese-related sulfurtransferase/DNA-binding HxlR family transcriptional regulator [Kribbella aluminosa]|uniref:Rhodanese-related sulfurtransferase/DNA-binding HxlR family transcriptional regulator n=1 Tax=Kribbella aluminosa TaxID=416017 RepID=A0ABS4V104_9ACTN|nr:metalloregulator ArsR/SmtB family transcription factor [Kribbella aluminosa]MBP2357592.1 rhodanese-related sulfurtransferase/DNA-binding HxlR family transcriptional regulator [Kribbella aluminosa]
MGDPVAKAALFEQFAQVGKTLGSAKRLELLDLLAQGERSVEVLAGRADLGLTTASNHLQLLRQAGLVTARKDGTKVYYRLTGSDVAALWAQLRDVASEHVAEVDRARRAYLGDDDIAEVTRDELLRRLKAGDVTVVDVRPGEEYSAGHIPGAVSIPVDELADRLAELPAGTTIVAYCRGSYCVMAHEAVRTLNAEGLQAVRLSDGMLEWRLADLPVAS